MKNCPRPLLFIAPLFALLAALSIGPLWAAEEPKSPAKVYVCPPCGCEDDGVTFDHPGVCPHCGMRLVERPAGPPPTVAILLFKGVQIIDYSGPWEVFGESGYHVITVAADAGPVRTVFGQNVLPDYTFANAPRADILVIPGGDVDEALCRDPALRHWVQGEAAGARQVLSVCTGAFIAASAGLLDGLTATTYHGALAGLARAAPLTHVVSDRRFVDNGKIITTAGLSSGIDGALHLVAKLNGLGVAQGTALNMEYNWDPASPYARAALADRVLAFPMDDFSLTYLSRTGDRTHWENRWLVSEEGSLAALSARIEHALAERGQWRKQADGSWAFRDASGAPWVGRSSLEAVRGQTGRFTWTLAIQRV